METVHFNAIESPRLVLRRFREGDAGAFCLYRGDERVYRYQGEGWENMTPEKALCFVTEQSQAEPGIPGTWFQFAVEEKASGRLIGDCGVYTQPGGGQAMVGITVSPDEQRKGFALETLECLLGYLFDTLGMEKVEAEADARNAASIGLLEKAGFKREAFLPKNTFIRGEWTDDVCFALPRGEYRRKNKTSGQ